MTTLHVSPAGNDRWSGRFANPNADRTDGPLKTLAGARDRVRALASAAEVSGPLTVLFGEGVYEIAAPVVFGPEDSYPVTYAAAPGASAVIDGGRRVTNFEPATLNGRAVWAAKLPEVSAGKNYLSFFVNGERRPRASLPKLNGPDVPKWLWMTDVPGMDVKSVPLFDNRDTFVVDPRDFVARENLADVEVVVMHYWVEERMPVASYDPETGVVRSSVHSRYSLRDDFGGRFARYYLDNVKEALTEPGEWYLDRPTATLYYMPKPGETPTNADYVLPRFDQLIRVAGDLERNRPVQFVRFSGLKFRHTDAMRITSGKWKNDGRFPYGSGPQSAVWYGGAIEMTCARHCAIEDCDISAVGWYGIDLGDGSFANRVVGNHLHDLGAGGVKVNGADAEGPRHARSGNNVITDNTIERFGRVFHAGAGVIVMDGFGNTIAHNLIRDGYYTGISVGWVWGYRESVSRDNRIEHNHIHQIGQAWLSDMGGIYTLGVQPGTTIKHNLIHDIHAHGYGGWGIYLDEGSSHIVIEGNVVHDCKTNCFNQHYGRENIVRNNVFADGGKAIASLGRREPWLAFTFQRNICIARDTPIWIGDYGADLRRSELAADYNIYHNRAGDVFCTRDKPGTQRMSIEVWRESGHDRHSLIEDPGAFDLQAGVVRVEPGSPGDRIGFNAIDLRHAGPRPLGERGPI